MPVTTSPEGLIDICFFYTKRREKSVHNLRRGEAERRYIVREIIVNKTRAAKFPKGWKDDRHTAVSPVTEILYKTDGGRKRFGCQTQTGRSEEQTISRMKRNNAEKRRYAACERRKFQRRFWIGRLMMQAVKMRAQKRLKKSQNRKKRIVCASFCCVGCLGSSRPRGWLGVCHRRALGITRRNDPVYAPAFSSSVTLRVRRSVPRCTDSVTTSPALYAPIRLIR